MSNPTPIPPKCLYCANPADPRWQKPNICRACKLDQLTDDQSICSSEIIQLTRRLREEKTAQRTYGDQIAELGREIYFETLQGVDDNAE